MYSAYSVVGVLGPEVTVLGDFEESSASFLRKQFEIFQHFADGTPDT